MTPWRSKKQQPEPEPGVTTTGQRHGPTPEEMKEAMDAAKRQSLQSDLRVLAARLRTEAPDQSQGFNAGIDWAVLWMENTANMLTEK